MTTSAATSESRLAQVIPALRWLPSYQRERFRADLIAGLTVWAVVVPQALAYAGIAGLSPQAGLFTAFAGALVYGLLGTSRQLVVSPTSGTAAVSAAMVAPLALGDPERFADLAALMAIMAGVVYVLLGWLKMGFISQFVGSSVQTGFLFGLGLTIIVGQVARILGIHGPDGTFVEQVRDVARTLGETHGWTVALGGASLAALLLLRRIAPAIPAAVIVVIVTVAVTALFDLSDRGVATVGEIGRQLPLPGLPTSFTFSDLGALFPGALAVILLGYTESSSVAEDVAEKHKDAIDANQELVALGVANIAAGLFRGFVTAGGASQSAANDRAGARTQMAVLILAALVALTAAVLLPLFSNLPMATLGAIVVSSVLGFLNVPALRRIRELRRDSFILALVALAGVLILGVLAGLLLAVLLSILLLLNHQSRPSLAEIGTLPGTSTYVNVARHPEAEIDPRVLVVRLDSPLLFINAGWVRDSLRARLAERRRTTQTAPDVVVLDLQMSSDLDVNGLNALGRIADEMSDQGIEVHLANVHGRVHDMLRRSGVAAAIGESHIHRDFRPPARLREST